MAISGHLPPTRGDASARGTTLTSSCVVAMREMGTKLDYTREPLDESSVGGTRPVRRECHWRAFSRGHREGKPKGGAVIGVRCTGRNFDRAAVLFDQRFCHPQSQSVTNVALGSEERFEDALQVRFGDTATIILKGQHNIAIGTFNRDLDARLLLG